jgi:hypothetical protein
VSPTKLGGDTGLAAAAPPPHLGVAEQQRPKFGTGYAVARPQLIVAARFAVALNKALFFAASGLPGATVRSLAGDGEPEADGTEST